MSLQGGRKGGLSFLLFNGSDFSDKLGDQNSSTTDVGPDAKYVNLLTSHQIAFPTIMLYQIGPVTVTKLDSNTIVIDAFVNKVGSGAFDLNSFDNTAFDV